MYSNIFFDNTTSNPVVGSSKNKIFESDIKLLAICTLCSCPPDNSVKSDFSLPFKPRTSIISSTLFLLIIFLEYNTPI